MFNPFFPFNQQLLNAFIKVGKKYFVRQSFNRAKDDDVKGCFIIMHYSNQAEAAYHFGKMINDPHRRFYDWDNSEHQKRLLLAASGPSGYKIYSSVVEDKWHKHITNSLKSNTRKYIDGMLCWTPGNGDTVDVDISITHGELYATLAYERHKAKVKLSVIENL